jgi:hypothetical protein
MVLFLTVLASFSLVEGLIGLAYKNVHVLRSFFNTFMLILAFSFSYKAFEAWELSD